MKKYSALIICCFFAQSLFGQEKYQIPVRSSDQKHFRTLEQAWVIAAAGINFAKTHGVAPYEYGKYMGNLFASTWGEGNDFDGLIGGMIFNLENFRYVTDPPIIVKENQDGSVSISNHDKMIHRFFPEGNPFASYGEFVDFMKGLYEPIANYMGATVKIECRDSLMICTYRKK
jgi:hypothetical protein